MIQPHIHIFNYGTLLAQRFDVSRFSNHPTPPIEEFCVPMPLTKLIIPTHHNS